MSQRPKLGEELTAGRASEFEADAWATDPRHTETEALGHRVLGCAISVHQALGPGLAEAVYGRALEIELGSAAIPFESQLSISIAYRGIPVGFHRLDVLVAGCIVLELKALPSIETIHRLQALSYMRASGCRLGYVLNFGSPTLGIRRVVL